MCILSELQMCSKQKEEELKALMKDTCKSVINRDLRQYALENVGIVKQVGNEYCYKGQINLRYAESCGYGFLEVEDRRSTAFLWIFSIEYVEKFRQGDIVRIGDMMESISNISDNSQEVLDRIKEAISEFDDSIELLKRKKDSTDWEYTYYQEDLDLHFNTIPELMERILQRELR